MLLRDLDAMLTLSTVRIMNSTMKYLFFVSLILVVLFSFWVRMFHAGEGLPYTYYWMSLK